ncbi:hypothetical protein D3C76_1309630 [compost metagenome]
MMKPESSGPATAMPAPMATALPISTALAWLARRARRATPISTRQAVITRSRPKRTARRGARGANRPMQSTGKAVVRLIRLRLRDSSRAMRSISGAREVMPGRRLMAASTSASISSARERGFTVGPSGLAIRPGEKPYSPGPPPGNPERRGS